MTLPQPFSVTVYPFLSPTSPDAFSCAYERGNTSSRNALVYIGGLTSGPHTTVTLLDTLLAALDDAGLGYSIWEFRMRSSYTGWGYSSLANDVEDVAALVKYLISLGKRRIVLLGSSTGCQVCMEYLKVSEYSAPEVDAYILQAPTSDRVTAGMLMSPDFYRRTLDYTKDQIAQGNKDSIMPRDFIPEIFTSPISAYRWHSLIAEGGDDDYFSPDLDDATLAATFGRINKPTLIMPSEYDEMIPDFVHINGPVWKYFQASSAGLGTQLTGDHVAKVPRTALIDGLLQRWSRASPAGLMSQLSGHVPKADHTLSAVESQRWFAERVVRFLRSLDGVHA